MTIKGWHLAVVALSLGIGIGVGLTLFESAYRWAHYINYKLENHYKAETRCI